MIEFRPFRVQHYAELVKQGKPTGGQGFEPTPEMLKYIERSPSFTGFVNGVPIGMAAVLQLWPGSYTVSAYLTEKTAPHMVAITRTAKQVIDSVGPGRFASTTIASDERCHRWLKMLGFEIETPLLRKFGPDGADHVGFVLIRE